MKQISFVFDGNVPPNTHIMVVTIYQYDGLSRFEHARFSYRKHLHIHGLKKMNEKKKISSCICNLFLHGHFTLHSLGCLHALTEEKTTETEIISNLHPRRKWEYFGYKKRMQGCPWGRIPFTKNVDAIVAAKEGNTSILRSYSRTPSLHADKGVAFIKSYKLRPYDFLMQREFWWSYEHGIYSITRMSHKTCNLMDG